MDAGIPLVNCLLQQTLRNLCTSSKWVYSVFWRILPRNYPPPKWEHGGSMLDRVKGNRRNWILVWEDGFCDFIACERAGKRRFGADVFFKMSHEVYNFGEGLVGKTAADNSHKWVFGDGLNDTDPSLIPSWNASLDQQPKAWEAHFDSGIQTIAIISVREGIIQLGSFDKNAEDVNLVISIQRKFSYLQSLSGIYAIQRPYLPIEPHFPPTFKSNPTTFETNQTVSGFDDKRQLVGSKRLYCDRPDDYLQGKSINLGYNSPHHNGTSGPSLAAWSIPPLLPSYPSETSTLKFPALLSSSHHMNECNGLSNFGRGDTKLDDSCTHEEAQDDETGTIGDNVEVENKDVRLEFLSHCKAESDLDLN